MARTQALPWDEDGEDVFDGSPVETGRKALPFTYVHDWVTLSAISPAAKTLYTILRMYVYDKSGNRTCGPRQEDLALMMGFSAATKLRLYLKELDKLKAVEVIRWGNPARNKYVVHETPPESYDGPTSIAAWKAAHAQERARRKQAIQAANKAKKQRLRTRATAGQTPLPL